MVTGYIICGIMSAITMYFSTKITLRLANKWGFYDTQSRQKKPQQKVPLLGGLALIITIALNTMMFIDQSSSIFITGLIGACFIFGIGLIDDKYSLQAGIKLLSQVMIVSFVWFNGVSIDYISVPFATKAIVFSPVMSFIVTQLWMCTIINIFNLIDGVDGLAIGVSFITALMLFIISISVSPVFVSFMLVSIAGASLAFLKFNFHPAKMYLGDSGSLLLGYLFAFCSVVGVMKSTISIIVIGFIFAYPFIDLVLSIIRRLIQKKHVFSPDLLHIHHQLVRRGISVKKAVLILYTICGCFGGGAILISLKQSDPIRYILITVFLACVVIYFASLQVSKKRFKSLK